MRERNKPAWAGDDIISRCVNVLIQMKPIYALMRTQARQVLIKTAERNGIPWRETYEKLERSGLRNSITALTNPKVIYPSYYHVPFHAYPEGNLCWPAEFEAESATYSMALRVWPDEPLTWEAAQERLRASFHEVLQQSVVHPVRDILDLGCSVGISTLSLHRFYVRSQAQPPQTIGLDLSPYMLAVAEFRDTNHEVSAWVHGLAEATAFPDASFDLITLQFVTHELPHDATQAIFREAFRLLRIDGSLAIVDNNPRSPVIQNLPPVLFTLMKSTEPWSDDYYTFDVEAALEAVGFAHQVTVASDPRHRAIVARKLRSNHF